VEVYVRSAESTDYVLPRLRTKFTERAFSYVGPAVWNRLRIHPQNVISGSLQATTSNIIIIWGFWHCLSSVMTIIAVLTMECTHDLCNGGTISFIYDDDESTAVWRHSSTMSFIGWMCQRGSLTRWVSWCTAVFTVRHLGTSPTISSHPPTSLLGFVCVLQTDTSSSCLAVVQPSGVFDRWSGGLELAAWRTQRPGVWLWQF